MSSVKVARPGRPPRNRRRLGRILAVFAALVLLIVVAVLGAAAVVSTRADVSDAGRPGAGRELEIPRVAQSQVVDGRRVFDLTVQAGETDLGQDVATRTLGVNQSYLGPTLRMNRGEQVQVDVTNRLVELTTMHWHGMHLPARMDGGPHQPIRPGETRQPTWQVDQPAASLWYHPHLHGSTGEQVGRGVAGMILIDDEDNDDLDLPSNYGVDDVPVLIQDAAFDDGGQLDLSPRAMSNVGVIGDTVLANGTPNAYHQVTTESVRLRLLNASAARVYGLELFDTNGSSRPFDLIGTDGGLLESPVPVDRLRLSPGERAEVIVSMAPGQVSTLRHSGVDLGADFWNERLAGADDELNVLELRAAVTLEQSAALPTRLASAPDADQDPVARTRTFELLGVSINGRTMDHNRIDEVVDADSTEVWEITNGDGAPHNFHVHDVRFQVLG